ncbi:MAG: hypothetical protein Kow0042_04150 [Calditrichia bacterium]
MKNLCTRLVSFGIIVMFGLIQLSAQTHPVRDRSKSENRPIPSAADLLSASIQDTVTLPFFENFESGLGDWMTESLFHLETNPENIAILQPAINPTLVTLPDNGFLPMAFSGMTAAWSGDPATGTFIGTGWDTIPQTPKNGGTSAEPQFGSLLSPPIDLRGVSEANMSFQTWWEIEGVDVDAYDLMHVEISPDGGMNFFPVGRGLINPLNDVDGESWKPYSSGGLGQVGVWTEQLFDLSPWAGNVVHLRFRFDTVDELYNGFRGWLIDDVRVESGSMPPPLITGINPSTSSPGELVTLTGMNFVNGATVTVGNITNSAVVSSNTAQFETPFLAPDTYDVILTNPDNQSDTLVNGLEITNLPAPHILSIEPDSAQVGMSVPVTIVGQNFDPQSQVDIGGFLLQNQMYVSPDTITGDSPSALSPGHHTVVVTNPDGQFDQLILGFTVYDPTSIERLPGIQPTHFSLQQNYPNPFNPTTTIAFDIPRSGRVKLSMYNILGQAVQNLVNQVLPPGSYAVTFSGHNLPSGIYYYRLESGGFTSMKKLVLMK